MKKSSAQLTGVSALLLFLLAGASAAGADTFELRTGKNYEGAIMDEDTVNFYIDTPSDGVLSVRKVDVTTINGEPYQYMGQGTAPVKEGKPLPYLGYVSPEDRELEKLPKPAANTPAPFDGAAAAADGRPAAYQGNAMVHPSGVFENHLWDYYQAHKEEFRMPVQVRLKFINPLTLKGASPEKILQNPGSSNAWKDSGWLKKGDTLNAPFSAAAYEKIYALKKGATLRIDEAGGPYLFWASDRKESHILPYEQARPKVLTKILNQTTGR